jgi:RHS repeat-associated protein
MTYDEIDNLETFDGNTYTWEEGRRLKSITNTNQSISYMYNASGIRTSKTVDGVTTDYHLVGDKVTLETDGTNTIYYTYDASGKLISMNLTNENDYPNGKEFYYIRNAQGDITGLYDDTGKVVVEYSYDTWGKPESVTDSTDKVGTINPYRYRGYRYDSETGMYYLQSRYYSPEIGRFISADGYVDTTNGVIGANMFTYCGNNPVSRIDSNGTFWKEIGNVFKKVGEIISKGVKAVFGASSSTTKTTEAWKKVYTPSISPITVTKGTNTIETISRHGDSTKPISVYANLESKHPVCSSSAGLKVNIVSATMDIGLSLDDIGVYVAHSNGNSSNNLGIKINISEIQIGLESSATIESNGITTVSYTNVSLNGFGMLLVAAAYFTGGAALAFV